MRGSPFARALRFSSAGAAACGVAALVLGGERSPIALAPSALAIVLCGLGVRVPWTPRSWVVVQVVFLLGLAWAGLVARVHVLTVFGWLLLFVQLHRLLTRASARDDRYILFIAFGQLLLSSILTVDPAYFLLFVAFALVSCASMLLAGLAASAEDAAGVPRGRVPPPGTYTQLDALVRPSWIAAVAVLSVTLLVGTMGLFFLLPRLEGNLGAGLLPPLPVSGFDERVRLGALGTMQLSPEPVLRARFSDAGGREFQPRREPYWRGLALDSFDGRQWSISDTDRTTLTSLAPPTHRGPPKDEPWQERVDISLEPVDTRVIFLPDRTVGLYGAFRSLAATSTDGFEQGPQRQRVEYTAYRVDSVPPAERLRAAPAARTHPTTALSLPEDLDPRIPELAKTWAGGAASDYDRALLIAQGLSAFVYSLEMAASAYPDPLAAFLFDVEEGHCEYFASAMAVLLRTVSVPTRLVNGFLGGEWNELGGYMLVRQLHAHSWVEVWFEGVGWVPFDPTPASTLATGEARLSLLGQLRALADYGRLTWSSVLLDYGLDNQQSTVRAALRWLGGGGADGIGPAPMQSPQAVDARGPTFPAWLLGALGAVGLVALVARLLRRSKGDPLPPALRAADRELERLLRRWQAERRSMGHRDAEGTTADQARWAEQNLADQRGSLVLIDRWYRARYGGAEDRELARDLRSMRGRVVRAPRARR